MSVEELAAFVCTHLEGLGINVVLSGGACVTIYSDNRYQSFDIDFIDNGATPRKRLKQALEEIGFKEHHRYFKHADTEYFLEFPTGPLAVGNEPVGCIVSRKIDGRTLRLLSPTDCVKDRLAAYYHWKDRQSLDQAVLVASKHQVDLKDVQRWSRQEGMIKEYHKIASLLRKRKRV
ncbi:MAG: nucleotidyltransferase family protein [Candidatus Edwardsbacteria bacterium]|jgi:hypothetical protein|nr:nucleotidyltransferase family protein [Candidatus Edwardsbacteria bacterium]